MPLCCNGGNGTGRAQARARLRRFFFADQPPNLIISRLGELLFLQRRGAREQLVQQHAQRIDVAASVDVQPAHLGLFRAHVQRRADHLRELRVDRAVGELLVDRLGDAEVDDLGHRLAVVRRHQHIRRLDVAVDDSLLMRVLDGLTNGDEQVQPLAAAQLILIAVTQ